MNVCVVGAGPSGLVAGRHLEESKFNFDILERTATVGGTWVFSTSSKDKYGNPVLSKLYKNLRTNLPKDLMEFDGLKYTCKKSFVNSETVLRYLQDFTEKFNVIKNIKFGCEVKKIQLIEDEKWKITYKELEKGLDVTVLYDAVIICNGHYNIPRYPVIEGLSSFIGTKIHSKEFKIPEPFTRKNVLVIGFGSSGTDISIITSAVANKVFLSHHTNQFRPEAFPKNVISKPDCVKFLENSVIFEDLSEESIDAVIFCTGYIYSYPFLDDSCQISCEENYVRPLYKHFLNINHPTMCFVCLTFKSYLTPVMETQVKFFIKFLKNRNNFPIKTEMFNELKEFEEKMESEGKAKRYYHVMKDVKSYLHQLEKMANLPAHPEVWDKIFAHNTENRKLNVSEYRNFCYSIINENEFKFSHCQENTVNENC